MENERYALSNEYRQIACGLQEKLDPFDNGEPLSLQTFSSQFPHLLRVVSYPIFEKGHLKCVPQSGEWHRFGVFFWALAEEPDVEKFQDTKKPIIAIKSEELFNAANIPDSVVEKGIVVYPSKYHKQLISEVRARKLQDEPSRNPNTVSFYVDTEGEITKNYLVVDINAAVNHSKAIFTIPSTILVPMRHVVK